MTVDDIPFNALTRGQQQYREASLRLLADRLTGFTEDDARQICEDAVAETPRAQLYVPDALRLDMGVFAVLTHGWDSARDFVPVDLRDAVRATVEEVLRVQGDKPDPAAPAAYEARQVWGAAVHQTPEALLRVPDVLKLDMGVVAVLEHREEVALGYLPPQLHGAVKSAAKATVEYERDPQPRAHLRVERSV